VIQVTSPFAMLPPCSEVCPVADMRCYAASPPSAASLAFMSSVVRACTAKPAPASCVAVTCALRFRRSRKRRTTARIYRNAGTSIGTSALR
jgi:hypothetical protein